MSPKQFFLKHSDVAPENGKSAVLRVDDFWYLVLFRLTKIGSIDMSNKINKLVYANNKFAFQLFSEIQKSQANENIFISPSSIAIALSVTYNCAVGKTQEAMAKTLNFEGMS
ncbi:MAG: hypothetical protein F6K40_35765 [Okeania sp. SIO3I5]|uniref:serpin family protein n=1 Tax=Okeania sp. SIO3I5 TaxID=2607805 RepID=UPI0013B97D6E|nr:serpin family protein [Okeania sp. SIO3I5]NEQ41271.1 hypothetical protein [Okeania sp. SIO3I5]